MKQTWSKELITAMLLECAKDGIVSSGDASRKHISLPAMANRYFGSFSAACESVGLSSASAAQKTATRYSTCTVDGCNKPVRSALAVYCNMHYARVGRLNSIDLVEKSYNETKQHSSGYVLVYAPEHPLNVGGSYVYEHRKVYYDIYGAGPFNCHWCNNLITWKVLHIDHVDNVKTNNHISNLVASCAKCNQARGKDKMVETLWNKGKHITFQGVTKHIKEWSYDLGISSSSLANRLKKWPLERAMTEPKGTNGPTRTLKAVQEAKEATERAAKRRADKDKNA